ncbi:MAG: hypothetical protein Q4E67_06435 [Planctomycetia bacterium]|nr:hypothetical protein [Planctomycetia bacterium]
MWKKTTLWLMVFSLILITGKTFATTQETHPYTLTPQQGPWLVMAKVFADENVSEARRQAIELAKELREEYRMSAYIYEKVNPEGEMMEGRPYWVVDEDDPTVQPVTSNKYRYLNPTSHAEFAVLVGDFPALEDSRATKMLEKVRHLQPKCLKSNAETHPLLGMAGTQTPLPLSRAFVVANPLLPKEYFVSSGLDPVVLAANKDIKKHSLLDCPGTYSVQVAVLKGITTLDQQKIAEIKRNEDRSFSVKGQTLADADAKAVILCEELRKRGYEAYVFRDHYASIVTIGSFDTIGSHQNGEFVLVPQITEIFKTFSATCDPSQGLAGIKRKVIQEIPAKNGAKVRSRNSHRIAFDITPKIIMVPRRPVVNSGFSFAGK